MKCEPRLFKKKKEEVEEPGPVTRDDGCICPPEKKKKEICKMPQCPFDPRFPQQNVTRRCYFSFVDYQRCARLLGDYPGCNYFLVCWIQLCPKNWTDKWFRQMEEGTFPRIIYPPRPIVYPDLEACMDYPQDPVFPKPQSTC